LGEAFAVVVLLVVLALAVVALPVVLVPAVTAPLGLVAADAGAVVATLEAAAVVGAVVGAGVPTFVGDDEFELIPRLHALSVSASRRLKMIESRRVRIGDIVTFLLWR
jgi:hypothetical protein